MVPALTACVGHVAFLACALGLHDAFYAVPYGIDWAGASWFACGLVACVLLVCAATLAWAQLELTAGGADNVWFAFLVDNLLHAFRCADHVCAVDVINCNSIVGLVEFALVVAWTVDLLDALATEHDCTGRALTTAMTFGASESWALGCSFSKAVASSVAQAL